MYKFKRDSNKLTELTESTFSDLELEETKHLEQWLIETPEILEEEIKIITNQFVLPSNIRLDVLAIDRRGNLVIIEVKKDSSTKHMDWQTIKYASYCSFLQPTKIIELLSEYEEISIEEAKSSLVSYLEVSDAEESDSLISLINKDQRLILVAKDFEDDVLSSCSWLINKNLNIKCITLKPFTDVTCRT